MKSSAEKFLLQKLTEITNQREKQKQCANHPHLTKKCSQQMQAPFICINPKCQQENPFLCQKIKCLCHNIHYLCHTGKIQQVLKGIQEKIYKKNEQNCQVQKMFNESRKFISDVQENLKKRFPDQVQYINLTKCQKNFLLSCKNPRCKEQFSGQTLSQMWKGLSNKNLSCSKLLEEQIKKRIAKLMKITRQNCENVRSQIDLLITQCSNKNQQTFDKGLLKQLNNVESIYQISNAGSRKNNDFMLIDSEIKNKLNKLFKRNVKTFWPKFKASLQNFSLKKYYQICGETRNTVILCKNNKNKIFGGFTPLSFISNPSQTMDFQSVKDPSNSSFVFSINQNAKFDINDGQWAIIRWRDQNQIQFCNSLCIQERGRCYFYLGRNNYDSSKYPKEKQSFLKLTGYQNQCWFDLIDFQVYQAQYE